MKAGADMASTFHSDLKYLPLALAAAALGGPAAAQPQSGPAQARVVSSTPIRTPDGVAGYSVTYEYNGHQYSARTDDPPGATMPVQVTPMGVMTSPVQDPRGAGPAVAVDTAPAAPYPPSGEPWRAVAPEPGVVVSGGGAVVAAPAPVYVAPAPVYVAPAVYPRPYYGYYGYGGYGYGGYGWGAPYGYGYGFAPGVSLNLGYTYHRHR